MTIWLAAVAQEQQGEDDPAASCTAGVAVIPSSPMVTSVMTTV
jgi:hypothetical protein